MPVYEGFFSQNLMENKDKFFDLISSSILFLAVAAFLIIFTEKIIVKVILDLMLL